MPACACLPSPLPPAPKIGLLPEVGVALRSSRLLLAEATDRHSAGLVQYLRGHGRKKVLPGTTIT